MEYNREPWIGKLAPPEAAIYNHRVGTSFQFISVELFVREAEDAVMASEVLQKLDDADERRLVGGGRYLLYRT